MKLASGLRRRIKKSLAHALYETGLVQSAFGALRRLDSRRRLIVVVYHKVFPSQPHEQSDGMPPEIFDDQIRTIKELFDVLGPDAATGALTDPGEPSGGRYPLLVTFDDGFVNTAEHALPILQRHAVPGLFFVATRLLGTDGFLWTDEVRELLLSSPLDELRLFRGTVREESFALPDRSARLKVASRLKARLKTLGVSEFHDLFSEIRRSAQVPVLRHHAGTRMLDWSGVARMSGCGMTIGSHSGQHFIVTRLSEDEFETELQYSRQAIEEHLGRAPRYFAYPNGHPGDFDARTAAQVARTGVTHAFTMVPGIATENCPPLMLPRYCPTSAAGALVAFDLLRLLIQQMVSERLRRTIPASVIPLRGPPAREDGPAPLRAAG